VGYIGDSHCVVALFVRVDFPCTSKLYVRSRFIKPLAIGLLEWKLLSSVCITFGVKSGMNHDQSQLKFR